MSIHEDYELDPGYPLDDLHHTLYAENTRLRDSLWDLAARRAEFDAARVKLDAVRALAAEHWDWKAGQVLARRLREALSEEPYTDKNGVRHG